MPDTPPTPDSEPVAHHGGNFRRFFLRGLAILLPTVITIWLFVWAYGFVQNNFAGPINEGVKLLLVHYSPLPAAMDEDYDEVFAKKNEDGGLTATQKNAWTVADEGFRKTLGPDVYDTTRQLEQRRHWMRAQPEIEQSVHTGVVERWWTSFTIGSWVVMDLIGLIIAIILIYIVGWLVGSFIGRRLYYRGEELIHRVPVIRSIYPSIKQVTDFFVGAKENRQQFSAVVAVEYPRKGLWSVGLVTGETMRFIQQRAGQDCLTVFIPSSPTPFTGYVITVPKADTIDLPITIEEAIKFAVSGGVLIPPGQQIVGGGSKLFATTDSAGSQEDRAGADDAPPTEAPTP
jgi:uncharacterized membrane protein